ncbi:scarlet, partial [Asbolus verrucosus]
MYMPETLPIVCGVAYPGELLVILGSSGSGKTTLLNALTFHSPSNVTVSGNRCINGILVSANSLTSRLAYIQQDDMFIDNLTVKEHLIFQALVRMDREISYKERMQRVEEVMLELALTECQDSQIGITGKIKGISGGEKKRLAFAAEVLTNPKLMCCDEPTSGLDSYMALNVAPCPVNYNPADFYVQLLAIVPEREEERRKMIGVIIDKYTNSNLVGPPLVMPFLLFGGFLLNISSILFYLKWFSYLSWFRFGFEAMMDSSGIFGDSDSLPKRVRTYSQWSPMEEGVTLAWRDVSVYVNTTRKGKMSCKRIINGGKLLNYVRHFYLSATGAIRTGSLVALMGASGAGKSTLMSTLAYRNSGNTYVEGDVLINGRSIGSYMKYLSGFMHQEDLFVGSLTVLEHMNIMARLKLDRRTTQQERNSKIYQLLKSLGLTKCLNTKIGRVGDSKVLSGGEKKRLSFATELLTDPPILFCDEPTTGLDSYSAQKIVTMMNMMTCDIFAMFSQLILMAEGRIAFMGSAASAIQFFEKVGYRCPSSYNPADFFIKILATTPGYEETSKQSVKRICDHFAVSDYNKEVDVIVQYEFHMGRAVETKTYKLRINLWFIDLWRNPALQIAKITQKIAVGVMIGLCYLGINPKTQVGVQNVQGAIFLLVTENTFTPMYSILDEFPQNYPLFLREYKSGLYPSVIYYLSRILSMLPGLIIESVLFVIIVYWLSGLRATTYAFLMTTLAGILTLNAAAACACDVPDENIPCLREGSQ